MELVKVESSNVDAVGFKLTGMKKIGNKDIKVGVLVIQFKGGTQYEYQDVPEHIHAGLMMSESKGRYIAYMVKDRYDIRKLAADEKHPLAKPDKKES